jgi:hypothetical protein
MAETGCENCGLRAKYDQNPRSFLGRLWRFHTSWCPGWKKYMKSLPDERRIEIARRYGMKKYMRNA